MRFPFHVKNITAERSDIKACIEAGLAAASNQFNDDHGDRLLGTLRLAKLCAGTSEIGNVQCPAMAAGFPELEGDVLTFAFAFDDAAMDRFGTGFKLLTLVGD